MTEINPVQFGQMIQSVQELRATMGTLQVAVSELADQVREMQNRWTHSRGFIAGALLVGVMAIYGAQEFVSRAIDTFIK